MRKLIIALVVASASLVPGLASSQTPTTATMNDLQVDAPSEYVVKKGDTLWAISGKFLKEPWKWPQLWQMNREQIKNPHLIYPGDIIRLDRSGASPSLSLGNVVRLEPRTRVEPLASAVPTIPGAAIGPFLTQPLVVEPGAMDSLPQIVAAEEERVIVGAGKHVYVSGLRAGDAVNWQVFRPGEALADPETGEILGFEAIHIGDARVKRFGATSTVEITKTRQEINLNDRLMPAREVSFPSFVPRSPDKMIRGTILSVRGGVSDIAQYSIVAINRGSRDGVEVGHVLATMRRTEVQVRSNRPPVINDLLGLGDKGIVVKPIPVVPDTKVATAADPEGTAVNRGPAPVVLPDERSGLVMVFRTFEKVSYGMIMKSVRPISIGDAVQTP